MNLPLMKKLVSAWLLVTSLGMLSLSIAAVSGAAETSSSASTPAGSGSGSGSKDRPALRGGKALGPFSLFDTNHDGTISSEEIASASAALKKLDKNNDGKLTADELRPPRPPRDGEDRPARGGEGDMPPPPEL